MKNILGLLCLMLILVQCKDVKESVDKTVVTVNFEITLAADSLVLSDTIWMAGNHKLLGSWNPANTQLLLIKGKENKYRGEVQLLKGTALAYKYTRGNWDLEETTQEGYTPSDKHLLVQNDTTVQHTIHNWKDVKFSIQGQVTGDLRYHKDFEVKGLPNRDVLVWLPPNYEKDGSMAYPVLYMHDAQNVFDPRTSTLKRDWEIDETADRLIRAGEVEPFIVVAVNCTNNRGAEYSYEPEGVLYQDFMCHQLKPFIDANYRTKPEAENTATMGASMGGLISFILAWEHRETFSKAACLSPAFKIRTLDYAQYIVARKPKDFPMLYLDNGGVGLEEELQTGIDATMNILKKMNCEYVWVKDEMAEHNEIAWANRAEMPIKMFFGKE